MTILSVFGINKCQSQSTLPAQMPAKISIVFFAGGGKSPAYKRIKVENGTLKVEERSDSQMKKQDWSANISKEKVKKLYQVFIDNSFDQIKNKRQEEIVYDAGSEMISLTLDLFKTYNVYYGKNSPLSSGNLRKFNAIKKAIDDLVESVVNPQIKEMSKSEAEEFLQGKWQAGGESGGHTWFIEWTFDNGNFKQTGYPPILQEGKYKIESVEKEKIILELYEQKGTFEKRFNKIELLVEAENKTLTIWQTKNFSKVEH